MKKNKTVAYMMAAMLLVGGTFVGTKALFTDADIAENGLIITTGEIGIEVDQKSEWEIEKSNGEVEEIIKGKEFTGLKTGDKLVKNITIKNTGDLYRKINIDDNGKYPFLPDGIEFSAKSLEDLDNKIVSPDEVLNAKLELEVTGNHKHNEDGSLNKTGKVNVGFSDMKYYITAIQVTKEEMENHTSK